MISNTIIHLQRILTQRNRKDLAELLVGSNDELDVTNSFGSKNFSLLSTYRISSPFSKYELLNGLPEKDKEEILKAILLIYPVRDHDPEVRWVEYLPNLSADENSVVSSDALKRISFDHIRDQIQKCEAKIAGEDFEGAVTNARNLVESICLFILEEIRQHPVKNEGDLPRLYREVTKELKLAQDDTQEQTLKQMLTGMISIIQGIASFRNNSSDAHGSSPSSKLNLLEKHQAIMVVNLAKTLTEFLFIEFEKAHVNNDEKTAGQY